MMSLFDKKNFNGEVFGKYVAKTPNLARNELLKSKAVVQNQALAGTFKDQTGGHYAVVPITARIKSDTTQNYDGKTDITASNLGTYTQGKAVIGRADAWVEKDFSYDITGGVDFLQQIAGQVGEYWDDVDQGALLATLDGIFSMTGAKNKEFVDEHTYDVSDTNGGIFDATTLNNGMQKALGDNKSKFALAIMHSSVATGLENLNLLEYMKYTDKQGIERSLAIATLNGRVVLVDDGMPVEEVTGEGAGFKYTTYVLGEGAIEYVDCGVKTPYETKRDELKNGGEDYLIGRQRKLFSPYGISFKDGSIISPTNAQLSSGTNWELANSNESTKDYFPHKAIPIARIISR